MTSEEYIRDLEQKTANLQALEQEAGRAISDAHRRHMNDIFGGMDGTNYSTKPMLAGSNVFGNVNKFGGTSYSFITQKASNKYFGSEETIKEQKWVSKSTPKGRRSLIVIEGGYAEVRRAEGRQTAKVDLSRTRILERDYRTSLTKTDFGWVSGLRREENFPKWEGAQARYGEKLEVSTEIVNELTGQLGDNLVKFLTQ